MTALNVILRLVEERQKELALLGYHRPVFYVVLHEALRDAVRSGQLPAHTVLPPMRGLSKALGCSRPTLARAVEMLKSEGLLLAKKGSRITIAPMGDTIKKNMPMDQRLLKSVSQKASSFLTSVSSMLLASADTSLFAGFSIKP